ncbi:uncharacterized protein LOC141639219 isoform X2 [Silene latifolia]|uniref:uncharacterized protein LOC141639219 isoform X2 n=1 Tax=Silene latifolia TaxID=37657 RepID=UPI003D771B71
MEDSQSQLLKYSCKTAAETLEWIIAITDFLKPYSFFLESNVVDFLKDRQWEAVDKDWINCLKSEPVEHLLLIPSGIVQDHWPSSLKKFVLTAKLLAYPRHQADIQTVLPGMSITPLNNVLSQGMNPKKKHEIEILSSLVSCTSRHVGAHTVVDVGAGQGYLTQVLAFQYQLPVVAIDASSHHGEVTNIRTERIKKHYMAKLHKSGLGKELLNMPKIITSRIVSSSMLRELSNYYCQHNEFDAKYPSRKCFREGCDASFEASDQSLPSSDANARGGSTLVLAGLHACGDLSVTMLRAMVECQAVKAVVSIGCCYNLLSEDGCEKGCSGTGFPVSKGVKSMAISLGKNSRDLACQSAERWRDMKKDAGVQNFDLHAFRAAFQMHKTYHSGA